MPRKSATKKTLCHIHSNVRESEVEEIRQSVCVKESEYSFIKHTDGNYYCLFHLPTQDKDDAKFREILKSKFDSVNQQIAKVEKLSANKGEKLKSPLSYDFRFVFFSVEFDLSDYKFEVSVYFNSAIFFADVKFASAIFVADANFSNVVFTKDVYFNNAVFNKDVYFVDTVFSKNSQIEGKAYFSNSSFHHNADFTNAIFNQSVSFDKAIFLEKSQILFLNTKFKSNISFYYSHFSGYLAFEGSKYNRVFVGKSTKLNLQFVRIECPEKIAFHTVRLESSWFINTNANEFSFTDCRWRQSNDNYLDVIIELQNISEYDFANPNAILTKACLQLAENHEKNNSFQKSSMFRRMANESKRLEGYKGYRIRSLHWWYWLLSFYGESWQRALAVLFIILFGFALIYTQTNFQACPNNRTLAMSISECETTPEKCKCRNGGLNINDAVNHSIATALFQNVEYRKPLTGWGELATYLEKILAPLQAALLALAIRRKFMR